MSKEIKFRAWVKEENPTKRKGKGWYKMHGYILQYVTYHPYANSRGYVLEHRLVMENALGRYLIPREEIVHHKNENRSDNRIENLVLMNPRDHAKGHIGGRNPNGQRVASEPMFKEKKYRLFDSDRNITRVYDLQELISKTFRRGNFQYRGEFTGLKDRNGVEIYEGDIVQVEDDYDKYGFMAGEIREIYYSQGGFRLKPKDNSRGRGHYIDENEAFEVIGNIHENPELLT